MHCTQTNCWRNFVILGVLICFTSCVSSLKGSSYEGPSNSIETKIMISISCPSDLTDQLVQECLSVQAPQQLEMNHMIPSHNNSQFQLSYHSISTLNLNRILALLDEKGRVKYWVSKL